MMHVVIKVTLWILQDEVHSTNEFRGSHSAYDNSNVLLAISTFSIVTPFRSTIVLNDNAIHGNEWLSRKELPSPSFQRVLSRGSVPPGRTHWLMDMNFPVPPAGVWAPGC